MPGPDDLPPLSPRAAWVLAVLIGVLWVAMRVRILRRQDARRAAGEPRAPAWRWLRALADSPRTNPVLAGVAVVLGALLAWLLAHGG